DAQFKKWDKDLDYIKDTGKDSAPKGLEADGFAAYRAEKFGDLPLAAGRYEALADRVRGDAEKDARARQWLLLATGKTRELKDLIKTKSDQPKTSDLIKQKLADAANAKVPEVAQEETLKARLQCLNILALYDGEESLKDLLDQARELKKDL